MHDAPFFGEYPGMLIADLSTHGSVSRKIVHDGEPFNSPPMLLLDPDYPSARLKPASGRRNFCVPLLLADLLLD
jgi:hypothetical protein